VKKVLLILIIGWTVALPAQSNSEEVIAESFKGMFDYELEATETVPQGIMDPGPPVPLDCEIVLLMACSLFLGFRYYWARRAEQPR
jgi:hypothetical protein